MKKHLISFLKLGISLGVGVGLVYWFIGQMSEQDKQQVVEDMHRANYLWVLVGPTIGFVSNFFRSERWRLLLQPLGYNPGRWNTYFSVMIMYFLNLFFPRLGEVSRCGILARYDEVPLDKAVGTMVVERLLDVVCIGIIALVLLLVEHDKFLTLYDQILANSKTTFAEIISRNGISPVVKNSVLALVVLSLLALLAYQIRKWGFQTMVKAISDRFMGLMKGIISIKDLHRPWLFLFHTVAIWFSYFLMGYLSFRMFPETSSLPVIVGWMVLFFSGIAFSLTPGGLGLYPIFTQIVLGLYGIATLKAMSFGLLVWTTQTISVLLGGLLSLLLLAMTNKEPALEE